MTSAVGKHRGTVCCRRPTNPPAIAFFIWCTPGDLKAFSFKDKQGNLTCAAMGDFVAEAFTLLAVAIVIIGLRTTARWIMVGPRYFQPDDYLMLLAGMVYGLETAAAYMVGAWFHGLTNNAMTDEERMALSADSEGYRLRVGGSKVQVAGWSLYTLLLWLLKTCMAIFYSRLTAGLINMRVRIHIAYGLIAATYIATLFSILFGCHPMHKNWQIYPNPGNYCQPAVSIIDIYVTVVLNVATDIYLISIPAPAGANGAEQAGSWACRETFVAVLIGNIPMIYPLCAGFPTDGYHKRKKFLHPLSLPADTQWNTVSDEQMILPTSREQAPACTAEDGDWETNSHTSQGGGIKVVHETMVHSAEKDQKL
ncbi:uncharacterized protein N7443_006276 [Penicillium atrosanguineum]|uniref:uncharacterized protein n=1 Tax=Penicillium atrosanguineum TaxID=1132637 RepID=UPI0023902A50|nr:uncharacterized protein N7443_006276 [Penicillium atrosanguineum]KAJ5298156.1 hypothetical protein N7443_006276 [Penicillium atrosanguineum]